VVTGLAVAKALRVGRVIEAYRTAGVVEHHRSGLLSVSGRYPPHKQKGRQENRAACRMQNTLTEPGTDLHIC